MGVTRQDSTRSILMLPWLAHGHISPYLELAKKLTNTKKFHVYFCSTPINLISIKKKLSGVPHSIELVELHLPSNHKDLPLPPHHHTTNGLPSHLMPTLKSAFEESKPSFTKILKTLNPDLVLYDFNMPWVQIAASLLKIPAVIFLPFGVVFASFALHSAGKESNEKYPFEGIYLHDHEIPHLENLLGCCVNGIRDGDRYKEAIRNSHELVLVKTSREIEGKFIEYLSGLTNKSIQPVGSLVQKPLNEEDEEGLEIMEWLEEKEESSTVFVSFGSEYFLSKQEIEEIAHGLELSEVNFIWVVRFPVGEKIRVEEVLPQGFLERLGGMRGLVIEGWAPQVQILRHRSIGGFVSHCGWNSVLESINLGVPIIAMPMHIDQPLNARVVEEIGVGMEVKRDKFGKFGRDEIARKIRMVVLENKGVDLKGKAKEISAKISRVDDVELDDVVSELARICGS